MLTVKGGVRRGGWKYHIVGREGDELLQLLSWSKKPLSLKDLSAQCGYPKSTVFGLLTTMADV